MPTHKDRWVLRTALPTEPALADARDRLEKLRRAMQELTDIEARYARAKRESDGQAATIAGLLPERISTRLPGLTP